MFEDLSHALMLSKKAFITISCTPCPLVAAALLGPTNADTRHLDSRLDLHEHRSSIGAFTHYHDTFPAEKSPRLDI